jgi:hypothetical protein
MERSQFSPHEDLWRAYQFDRDRLLRTSTSACGGCDNATTAQGALTDKYRALLEKRQLENRPGVLR